VREEVTEMKKAAGPKPRPEIETLMSKVAYR